MGRRKKETKRRGVSAPPGSPSGQEEPFGALEELSDDPEKQLLFYVTQYPKRTLLLSLDRLSPHVLVALALDRDEEVRLAVAFLRGEDPAVQEVLVRDPSPRVRRALLGFLRDEPPRPRLLPPRHQRTLAEDPDPSVRKALAHVCEDEEALSRLLAAPDEEVHQILASTNPRVELLLPLLQGGSERVKGALLRNPHLRKDPALFRRVEESLARDPGAQALVASETEGEAPPSAGP